MVMDRFNAQSNNEFEIQPISRMTHIFIFDRIILGFLNQFAQRSNLFDKSVRMFFGNALLEGGFITSLLWCPGSASAEMRSVTAAF